MTAEGRHQKFVRFTAMFWHAPPCQEILQLWRLSADAEGASTLDSKVEGAAVCAPQKVSREKSRPKGDLLVGKLPKEDAPAGTAAAGCFPFGQLALPALSSKASLPLPQTASWNHGKHACQVLQKRRSLNDNGRNRTSGAGLGSSGKESCQPAHSRLEFCLGSQGLA